MTVVWCGKVGHASGSERLVSARDMLCGNAGDDHCLVARKNTEIQQCMNTKEQRYKKYKHHWQKNLCSPGKIPTMYTYNTTH